ncbi:hypothetical protein PoB_004531200 [Plakobranchus ocellatus]|uniref:Uncharacterized protein n=1 Tax=Plakobranchus ocellatus TaxID=259542 RepID=A0AAV4BHN3_9GAST|nr:hypothetical protein PoB_004531200 [Plakobranchus ocellatus]
MTKAVILHPLKHVSSWYLGVRINYSQLVQPSVLCADTIRAVFLPYHDNRECVVRISLPDDSKILYPLKLVPERLPYSLMTWIAAQVLKTSTRYGVQTEAAAESRGEPAYQLLPFTTFLLRQLIPRLQALHCLLPPQPPSYGKTSQPLFSLSSSTARFVDAQPVLPVFITHSVSHDVLFSRGHKTSPPVHFSSGDRVSSPSGRSLGDGIFFHIVAHELRPLADKHLLRTPNRLCMSISASTTVPGSIFRVPISGNLETILFLTDTHRRTGSILPHHHLPMTSRSCSEPCPLFA